MKYEEESNENVSSISAKIMINNIYRNNNEKWNENEKAKMIICEK